MKNALRIRTCGNRLTATLVCLVCILVTPALAAPPAAPKERPTVDGPTPAPQPTQTGRPGSRRPPSQAPDSVDCADPDSLRVCIECGASGGAIACCFDPKSCEVVNQPPKGPTARGVKRPTVDGRAADGGHRAPTGQGSARPSLTGQPFTPHAAPPDTGAAWAGRFDIGSPDSGVITSDEFASDIYVALVGTELQVSHTQDGVVRYGPLTEVPSIPLHKIEDLVDKCDADTARGRDPADCAQLLEDLSGRVRPVVPVFRSWLQFGSTLRQLEPGLGSFQVLQIPVFKHGSFQFFVNYLRTKVDRQHFQASIADGGMNLVLSFEFGQPAILCAGTGGSLTGLAIDALCPDVRIQEATLALKLLPTAANGRPSYYDAIVDFSARVDLTGIRGDVASAFVDAQAELEQLIETQVHDVLMRRDTQAAIGAALTSLAEKRVGRLSGPIVEFRVLGTRLQLRSRPSRETAAPR